MNKNGLIIGAGPTGLAAGLFLQQHGIAARVIEHAAVRSPYSRALAVNPRTLDLLAASGVTHKLLQRGARMRQVCFWQDDKLLAEGDVSRLDHPFNFLLALSQAVTEEILADTFQKSGGVIERNVNAIGCRTMNGSVETIIENGSTITSPWALAADGAHSMVRHALNIPFNGDAYQEPWFLADVPLTDMPSFAGHASFTDTGFVFYIPVITDARVLPSGPQLWRVIGNRADMLQNMPFGKVAGTPVWESHFNVAHRLAGRLQQDNVYLAGDAAHVHSPLGARGMNLGIEDAYVFAALAARGQLQRFEKLRRPVDAKVVRQIRALTTVVRGQSVLMRLLRHYVMPQVINRPALFRRMIKTVTGLDHALGL